MEISLCLSGLWPLLLPGSLLLHTLCMSAAGLAYFPSHETPWQVLPETQGLQPLRADIRHLCAQPTCVTAEHTLDSCCPEPALV